MANITPEIDRMLRGLARGFKGDEDEIPTVIKVVYSSTDDKLSPYVPYVEIISGNGVDPDESNTLIDDNGMEFISTQCDECTKSNISNWTLPSPAAGASEAAERTKIRANG